jgi:hypothetical protein
MANDETPYERNIMTTFIVAIVSLLVGVVLTHYVYKQKIADINSSHKAELDIEFHRSYDAGWRDGTGHGRNSERLERIIQMNQKH